MIAFMITRNSRALEAIYLHLVNSNLKGSRRIFWYTKWRFWHKNLSFIPTFGFGFGIEQCLVSLTFTPWSPYYRWGKAMSLARKHKHRSVMWLLPAQIAYWKIWTHSCETEHSADIFFIVRLDYITLNNRWDAIFVFIVLLLWPYN